MKIFVNGGHKIAVRAVAFDAVRAGNFLRSARLLRKPFNLAALNEALGAPKGAA